MLSNSRKLKWKGLILTPVDLLSEDSNSGLVIAQFPVVKTHFGSLPQRELPPEKNPWSLPQAPASLSWAECTCAACHKRRCSGSQQCHSRCRGTLEQPLLEREFHLKHKNIRQLSRDALKKKGCGAVDVKNIINTQKSLLKHENRIPQRFSIPLALTCPKRKGEDGYKNSLHHLLLPNKEENGTVYLMNQSRTRHLLCGS